MKPIYFPATYVSPSAAAAMRAFFPSVVTCQPFAGRLPPDMRTLQESGFPDAPGARGAGPDVFVLPEADPTQVFARFLTGVPDECRRRPDERPWRHTVLVRVPLALVPGDGGTMPIVY